MSRFNCCDNELCSGKTQSFKRRHIGHGTSVLHSIIRQMVFFGDRSVSHQIPALSESVSTFHMTSMTSGQFARALPKHLITVGKGSCSVEIPSHGIKRSREQALT